MAAIGEPVKTYDIPDPEEIPDEVPQDEPARSEPAQAPDGAPVPA
jgi:hypothetical protein